MTTTIRRGRPRIGDAPADNIRLHARIPSLVKAHIDDKIGTDGASLRVALWLAVETRKADRVLAFAPREGDERDMSVPLSVVVPRDLSRKLHEIYGNGSAGLLRAFATVLVARTKGASE